MTTLEIISILLDRGEYNNAQAKKVAEELSKIDKSLKPALEKWLSTEETEIKEAEGISTELLASRLGMIYPAALLTIDWLIKEPAIALPAIKPLLQAKE